jgi:hypothetical protein
LGDVQRKGWNAMKKRDYPFTRCRVTTEGNVVTASTTFAGKTVEAHAKCDPRDEFDYESGKKLAVARCNAKVSRLRFQRAKAKQKEAAQGLDEAMRKMYKANAYFYDVAIQYKNDVENEHRVVKKLMYK